jgi:DNA transposition AAA+ family ATPase
MENNYKEKIIKAIKVASERYDSNNKLARILDINPAQLSQIINGKTDRILSDANWMSIARRLDVKLNEQSSWVTVKTSTFEYIYTALTSCQEFSVSGIICDQTDIGKTYTALVYAKENRNVAYIDCSQVRDKDRLIRCIAREFGLDSNGRYRDVYADLVFYLKNVVNKALVILDEAGDLPYRDFLELKSIWNATPNVTGWFMMGADGLKAIIERRIESKKVGYAEIFSRYGNRFQKVVPSGKEQSKDFNARQIYSIGKANGVKDLQKLYARCGGSLRRIYTEVQKQKQEELHGQSAISHASVTEE